MAIGMYMAHAAAGVTPLTIWRLITGPRYRRHAGSDQCGRRPNPPTRSRAASRWRLYVIGYPLGAVIGGFIAQKWLLVEHDWRCGVPVRRHRYRGADPHRHADRAGDAGVLLRRGVPRARCEKINRSLKAFGKAAIAALPVLSAVRAQAPRCTDILSNPRLRPVTLLLAFGYMFHTITFYYILKWAVKIVSDYPPGYSQPHGGQRADLGQHRWRRRWLPVRLPDEEVEHQVASNT